MNTKPDYIEFSDPRLVAIYNTVNEIDGYRNLLFSSQRIWYVDSHISTILMTHFNFLIGIKIK